MKVISYIITAEKFLFLPDVMEQCLIHMCIMMLDDLLPCNDIQVQHTVNNAYRSIMNNHDAALCTTHVHTRTYIVIMVLDMFSVKKFIIKQHTVLMLQRLLEQGQRNGEHGEKRFGELREAPGKKKLPQVHFVPRNILGCNVVPPVTTIYIQFMRHVYSCWMPGHLCGTRSGQCILNLDMASALFLSFPRYN